MLVIKVNDDISVMMIFRMTEEPGALLDAWYDLKQGFCFCMSTVNIPSYNPTLGLYLHKRDNSDEKQP